jgi:hypothetical protein
MLTTIWVRGPKIITVKVSRGQAKTKNEMESKEWSLHTGDVANAEETHQKFAVERTGSTNGPEGWVSARNGKA